jgi:hypothetical protein
MVDHWAYYDADGNRVPPQSSQARFLGKEVAIDSGISSSPGHAPSDNIATSTFTRSAAASGTRGPNSKPAAGSRARRSAITRLQLSTAAKGRKRLVHASSHDGTDAFRPARAHVLRPPAQSR